jgi:hypothetical protein
MEAVNLAPVILSAGHGNRPWASTRKLRLQVGHQHDPPDDKPHATAVEHDRLEGQWKERGNQLKQQITHAVKHHSGFRMSSLPAVIETGLLPDTRG